MLSFYQSHQIQQRYASTSNKVTLSSKIKPALSKARKKSKEGWGKFVSQVDVSKYQDRKWYVRPISSIYFSWCLTKVSYKVYFSFTVKVIQYLAISFLII